MGNEVQTYGAIGNREDLEDVISNITPEETPFYSKMSKKTISSTYHEWLTDSLASAGANANTEIADFSAGACSVRVRTGNYTQFLKKDFEVSYTQDIVAKAGLDSEMAYQTNKKLKELARDNEYALVNGTGNAGAADTARELKGVLAWITTNVITGTGTGAEALTEAMFNDCLQKCWDEGGRPNSAYCNAFQKRTIDSWKLDSQRTVPITNQTVNAVVDIYESSFGTVIVKLDRYMTASVVAMLQDDMWEIGVLERVQAEPKPSGANTYRKRIWGQMTLISRNEKASGKITGLTTSV